MAAYRLYVAAEVRCQGSLGRGAQTEDFSALICAMLLAQAVPDCAKNYFLSENYLVFRKISFCTFTGIDDSDRTRPEKGFPS